MISLSLIPQSEDRYSHKSLWQSSMSFLIFSEFIGHLNRKARYCMFL